ncbi:cell wall-binding repeat-containing protein [Desulfosporosinus meridiei]|nr:cell wall-binding repeat-containing protein [Desulfosporosinus meridiei]
MIKNKGFFALMIIVFMLSSLFAEQPVYGVTNNFIAASGGSQSMLALNSDGTVWGWGINQNGQIGDGTTNTKPYRVKVTGLADVKAIASGTTHSVALQKDGDVFTWGSNFSGELGNGTLKESFLPVQVTGLSDVKAVSAGTLFTVALKNDGTVWAWGDNSSGELGNSTGKSSITPVQIPGLVNISAVSAQGTHTLALTDDGTVWKWGGTISSPEKLESLSNIVAVSAGYDHFTALKADGTVWAWGENGCGQLGDGTITSRTSPIQVAGLTEVKAISAGVRNTIALRQDGTVWVWGIDFTKPMDQPTDLGYHLNLSPVTVPNLTNVQGIAAGPSSYLIITAEGSMLTWGFNQGILGDGTADNRTTPGPVVDSLLPDNMRLAGYDLIDTSIAISQKTFPVNHSADAVLLATGYNFPDALAGASLGVVENAPLLLVNPYTDNQKTIAEIRRVLKPGSTIYILGGTAVVSSTLEARLNDNSYHPYNIKRLAGVTHYGTAAEVAKQVKPSGGGEVIIATGENFPDALSISPYASAHGIPMVLVEKNTLPAESLSYLKDVEPTDVTIVGGVGAVSAAVEAQIQDLFPEANIRRFGGYDQYETSALIAKALFGDSSPNLFVATGTNFPDALSGSVIAGSTQSPIVLVKPNEIPEKVSLIYLNSLSNKTVVVLGGTSVVSESVFNTLKSRRALDPGNIQSNLHNSGLAAASNGWIYYGSGQNNSLLYKMKPDGSAATKVLDDSAEHLSAIGDSIYFSNVVGSYQKILNEDSPKPSLVSSAAMPYVFEDAKQVYYANDGGLYIDGDGFVASKQILNNSRNVFINSGYIYYQKASAMGPNPIYRATMDGTEETLIVDDDVKSFSISDNKLFYISYNNGKIYTTNIDGTGKREVTSDAAGALNVHNSWIYYSNKADGYKLYKVKLDGTSRTKLTDKDEVSAITIVGDWVFFTRGLSVMSMDPSVYMMKQDGSKLQKI